VKVALVHSTTDPEVLVTHGRRVREHYDDAALDWLLAALGEKGHDALALKADASLAAELDAFLQPGVDGVWPGVVVNLAYGVQGAARYTQVPGLLEMLGVPYVGSDPLAHALCLDKITSKILWRHHGLPTPDFAVLAEPDFPAPELAYPLVVKPRAETTSLGVALVEDEQDLREAVAEDLERFQQPVLVERYVEGRELNLSLLGNERLHALPPVEIRIDEESPRLFTRRDKQHGSRRTIEGLCPAPVAESVADRAADLARRAYRVLGCRDWARVDFRLDAGGELFLLEINSLPHLDRDSSYVKAARESGRSGAELLHEVIGTALARWRRQRP